MQQKKHKNNLGQYDVVANTLQTPTFKEFLYRKNTTNFSQYSATVELNFTKKISGEDENPVFVVGEFGNQLFADGGNSRLFSEVTNPSILSEQADILKHNVNNMNSNNLRINLQQPHGDLTNKHSTPDSQRVSPPSDIKFSYARILREG